jgi:hypothetical protein
VRAAQTVLTAAAAVLGTAAIVRHARKKKKT